MLTVAMFSADLDMRYDHQPPLRRGRNASGTQRSWEWGAVAGAEQGPCYKEKVMTLHAGEPLFWN